MATAKRHKSGAFIKGVLTAGLAGLVCLTWLLANPAFGADTMLMFVGEDLEVLSIASRKEEAAWSAPAIASVITREEISQKGAVTLAQALADTPGFHMNRTEKGHIPYLRGTQDSALFLFDTVPMGSGIAKSENQIDFQTSLAPIKRIEVVRGTGSVLWGPDAFAGVVNAVPLSGKDFQGVETGMILSSQDTPGEAYMNWGRRSRKWASFLSVSGRMAKEDDDTYNVVRFWNDGKTPEPIETRYGEGTPDDSRFVSLYGSLSYDNWLTFSVKIADNKNAYTVSDWDNLYAWEEQAADTSAQYKIEAVRRFTRDNGIRFTGYYTQNDQDRTYVDNTMNTRESSWYGEMIYDHSIFNATGLVTLGTSLRQDDFNHVPVWDSFLPEFFTRDNLFFLPIVRRISLHNTLASAFTQYRHDFGDIEAWAGIRYDDHDEFEDKTSYNAGLAWNLGDFILKTLYGTAYRSPSAKQLMETGGESQEKIKNFSAQLSWKGQDTRAALTLFNNKIDNHVSQNRYAGAGISTPNSQTVNGAELEIDHSLSESLSFSGNLTLLDNTGPNEVYMYLDYIDIDGVKHYTRREYAYDTGPKKMANFRATWQICDHLTLVPELKYFSERRLYYPKTDETRTCSQAWITDINLIVKDLFPFEMTLYANNIFDNDYASPGLYSIARTRGVHGGIILRYRW